MKPTCCRVSWLGALAALLLTSPVSFALAAEPDELTELSIDGGVRDGKARLIIEALLGGNLAPPPLIFSAVLEDEAYVERARIRQQVGVTAEILQGTPRELIFKLAGAAEIQQVAGEGIQDWSVRRDADGHRVLVVRPREPEKAGKSIRFSVEASMELDSLPVAVELLSLVPPTVALLNGSVRVQVDPALEVTIPEAQGLLQVPSAKASGAFALYRLHGAQYALRMKVTFADPEAAMASFRQSRLDGRLSADHTKFTLTGTARVVNVAGGSLKILQGDVSLDESEVKPSGKLRLDPVSGGYVLDFEKPGEYAVRLVFAAKVDAGAGNRAGWYETRFAVAPAPLQQLSLTGLQEETQFDFSGARPEWTNGQFRAYLPADGNVALAWKQARDETEGKLFYSADVLGQVTVSPGLMRQLSIFDLKIMQGELRAVELRINGVGEVTRVLGEDVLSWTVRPDQNGQRLLSVVFNQPQKNRSQLQVQMQTPLAAFPQEIQPAHLIAQGATRLTGYLRVVNEGAVRIEVSTANGLSQISPEQFPETDLARSFFRPGGNQRFAYRFAGGEFALRINADQVLPEVAVSEVLVYRLGENETTIEAELELDIREAPLRELLVRIPQGYAVARLTASGLNDYFVRDVEGQGESELRLVYGTPASGRQVVQLRLERNQPLNLSAWSLPRVEVSKAKSVRGHLGVAADPGYRVVPEATRGLTDIATAFFPRKVPGIQTAFRLSEPAWSATIGLQRLPQTVQVDAMHLFSIGEGIAYGSSVLNYLISGAPLSNFEVELSAEYFNVEFSGKDIRHWRKTDRGYVVQLHTPVAGAYTLLATYERPFKPQGETLTFNGARPLEVQSEQGHTLIISSFQFQVTPTQVSPGLLSLETGEVPPEYRLFFDAPVLAAYRYTSRPFNLQLTLAPLAQGDSLNLVVDRAVLDTRVSKEGQVLTDARYFVKNRGNPHFRVGLPADSQLWSVMVDGTRVVPVTDAQDNLIPLPQRADPNAVLVVDLKLASRSKDPASIALRAPLVGAPVMLAEWRLQPDAGRRLEFRSGSLKPTVQAAERSGLAQWQRLFQGGRALEAGSLVVAAIGFLYLAVLLWRWVSKTSAYRGGPRFAVGTLLGILAFVLGISSIVNAGLLATRTLPPMAPGIRFLAPIQAAGTAATVELSNVPEIRTFGWLTALLVPVLLAVILWVFAAISGRTFARSLAWLAGWGILLLQALRMENGAMPLTLLCVAFLASHVGWPAVRRLWSLPLRPARTPPFPGGSPVAPAGLGLLLLALLNLPVAADEPAARMKHDRQLAYTNSVVPESVIQTVRAENLFVFGSARIIWKAGTNQELPLLLGPAVMTRLQYPSNALHLLVNPGNHPAPRLLARAAGEYEIQVQYQVRLAESGETTRFTSPLPHGLINRLSLVVQGQDVEVLSPQAVSIDRKFASGQTRAELWLLPADRALVSWRPRSRDLASETPVYYAEVSHLYVPLAGVVEAVHHVSVRPAQGQLTSLSIRIPENSTVMDALDAVTTAVPATELQQQVQTVVPKVASVISLWRFDPDSRHLRLNFAEPQSRPFAVIVRTQVASGPLPLAQNLGLLEVLGAAGQIGSSAVATPAEVQLDGATPTELSPMNLEDFAPQPMEFLQAQIPGLTIRRAFRYSEPTGTLLIEARAVEPDIRAETQQTVSLGEDRVVIAANAVVNITRAGIFKLTFHLPAEFDVETISGPALSHWTESKSGAERVVTLHLNGRTEGQQQFSVTLTGPGAKAANGWNVPAFTLREATKEQGTLLLVPEQGMRLQPAIRENLTQLDPQKSGIAQKGVLAFRVLQAPWRLLVDIEQVDAWVQVSSLQHVTVAEAQAKVLANVQYQIENTGLKGFRISLPTQAENVRFSGEQVADFLPVPDSTANGLQQWEVKLHRRVIGTYRLQCNYQLMLPENATELRLRGVVADDVNLQRGFVTVESGGRLQLRLENPVPSLQATEWQSIPQNLRAGLQTSAAHFTFRLVEPAFELPLRMDRHQAARLLAARVNSVLLNSVVSDDGGMLTQARIEVSPGDKRLLSLSLPKDGRFWFAFVNEAGVWPWRDGDAILIPLGQHDKSNSVAVVEVFYSSLPGASGRRSLGLDMVAPRFDLPLENITWRVALDPRWKLRSWRGTMQLEREDILRQAPSADPAQYMELETSKQRERMRQAENLLVFGNRSLLEGEPQQARRAFQAAFGLSTHDAAFNEDARVQLHNLKVQQALVGLNMLQAGGTAGAPGAEGKVQELRNRPEANYTPKDAELILQRNKADDNAALTRLAERIVQQQDAVLPSPTAIRASIPEQGLMLTFKRSVLVDPAGTLNLQLEARTRTAGFGLHAAMLLGLLGLFWALARAARGVRSPS